MARYLIEVPNEEETVACARVVEIFLKTGSHFVTHTDWGCKDGEHKAWIIMEVDNKEDARRILPPPSAPGQDRLPEQILDGGDRRPSSPSSALNPNEGTGTRGSRVGGMEMAREMAQKRNSSSPDLRHRRRTSHSDPGTIDGCPGFAHPVESSSGIRKDGQPGGISPVTERMLRPMKAFQGGPVFFIDSLRTSLI